MAIYKLQCGMIVDLKETTFESEGILERKNLQRILRDRITIISPDTMVVSEEFGEWEDSKRRVDLLGLDKEAQLVVIELKRNETGAYMDLQAIRYAAMLSTLTFERVVDIYAKYLSATRAEIGSARDCILRFLGWDEPREDKFATDIRIVLVAAEFSKELTTAVMWLNDRDLDIQCVRIKPYKSNDDGQLLVDIQQIIPLPEAIDYQIQIREKSELGKVAKAAASAKDYTRYNFEGDIYWKNRLVLAVVSAYVRDNPEVTIDLLRSQFPDELQGSYGVIQEAELIKSDLKKSQRFFIKDDEILELPDEQTKVVVCNQWGIDNIISFIDRAKKLGFEISESD